MADNEIRQISEEDLIPKDPYKGSEKILEDGIIENITDISANCMWGDIKRIERQYVLIGGKKRVRADIMIWHTDGTGTLIEVKTCLHNRNHDLSAIGQLLFYGFCAEKVLGNMPRLVFAAPEIDREVYNVVKKFNIPISFLMIDGERCIYIGG